MRASAGPKANNPMYASALSQKDSHKSVSEKGGNPNKDYKKDYEKLLTKVEEQEKLLLKISEERNQYLTELNMLKDNLDRRKSPEQMMNTENFAGFQFWHVFLVAFLSLLAGAFLSS